MADDELSDDVTRNVPLQPRPVASNVAHVKPISREQTIANIQGEQHKSQQLSNKSVQSQAGLPNKCDTSRTTTLINPGYVFSKNNQLIVKKHVESSYLQDKYYLLPHPQRSDAKVLYQCVAAFINGTKKKILIPVGGPTGENVYAPVKSNKAKSILSVKRLGVDTSGKMTVSSEKIYSSDKTVSAHVPRSTAVNSNENPGVANDSISLKIGNRPGTTNQLIYPVSDIIPNEINNKCANTVTGATSDYTPPVKTIRSGVVVENVSSSTSGQEITPEQSTSEHATGEDLPLKIESVCTLAAPGCVTTNEDHDMPVLAPMPALDTNRCVKIKQEPSMEGYEGNWCNFKDTSDSEGDSNVESCSLPAVEIKNEPRDIDSPVEFATIRGEEKMASGQCFDLATQSQSNIDTCSPGFESENENNHLEYEGFGNFYVKNEPPGTGYENNIAEESFVAYDSEKTRHQRQTQQMETIKNCKVFLRKMSPIYVNDRRAFKRKVITELETAEHKHVKKVKLYNSAPLTKVLKKQQDVRGRLATERKTIADLLTTEHTHTKNINEENSVDNTLVLKSREDGNVVVTVDKQAANRGRIVKSMNNAVKCMEQITERCVEPLTSTSAQTPITNAGHDASMNMQNVPQQSNSIPVVDTPSLAKIVNSHHSQFQLKYSGTSQDSKKPTNVLNTGTFSHVPSPRPQDKTVGLKDNEGLRALLNKPILPGCFKVTAINGRLFLVPERPPNTYNIISSSTRQSSSSGAASPTVSIKSSAEILKTFAAAVSSTTGTIPMHAGNRKSFVPVSAQLLANPISLGNIKTISPVETSKVMTTSALPTVMSSTLSTGGQNRLGTITSATPNAVVGCTKFGQQSRVPTQPLGLNTVTNAFIQLPSTNSQGNKIVFLPAGSKMIISQSATSGISVKNTGSSVLGTCPSFLDGKPATASRSEAPKSVKPDSGEYRAGMNVKPDSCKNVLKENGKSSSEDLHAEVIRTLKIRLQESAAAVEEMRRQKHVPSISKTS